MDIFNNTLLSDLLNETTSNSNNASLQFSCDQCKAGDLCDVIRGNCLGRALAAGLGVLCGGLLVILTVGVLILVPALFNYLKQLSHRYRYRESHEYHRTPNKCEHVTFSLTPPEVNHTERPFRLDIYNDFGHAPHTPRDLASPMTEEECLEEDMSESERNGQVHGSHPPCAQTQAGFLYPALALHRSGHTATGHTATGHTATRHTATGHGILKTPGKSHNTLQP